MPTGIALFPKSPDLVERGFSREAEHCGCRDHFRRELRRRVEPLLEESYAFMDSPLIRPRNAEQELLQTQVALVRAKRDASVAGFQLLNAMGQAEAQDLGLDGGPLYDPLGNYRRVASSWSDWAGEPRHDPAATRTISPQELPPQPAVTPQLVPGTTLTEPVTTSGVTPPQQ